MSNKEKREKMKEGALSFANKDAAFKIADEAIKIAQSHEEI
jgi:UDP-N-acetylglucosamine:LPS N-acetylglucosamine transferase